jgi:hypothetical protein
MYDLDMTKESVESHAVVVNRDLENLASPDATREMFRFFREQAHPRPEKSV